MHGAISLIFSYTFVKSKYVFWYDVFVEGSAMEMNGNALQIELKGEYFKVKGGKSTCCPHMHSLASELIGWVIDEDGGSWTH